MRLLLILSTLSLATGEFLTFHSNQSAAWYVDWLAESGDNLEFNFRSRTADRILLQLIAGNVSWSATVTTNGMLVREEQSAVERLMAADLLEDRWIQVSVRLTNQTLSFSLTDTPPVSFQALQDSKRYGWLLGSEVSSFAGCIRNVRLRGQKVSPSAVQNVSLGERCEVDLKLSFVDQSGARAVLPPWQPFPSGRMQFQFATLSHSATLLSLSAPRLLISCSVSAEGLLTAETRNSSHSDQLTQQLILSDTHVTTNTWTTLSLLRVPSGLRVQVSTATHEQSAVLSADLSAGDLLEPVLGGGAFLGCMRGVKVSNQSAAPLLHSAPFKWRGVVIGPRCADRCENVSCGEGVCVNAWSGHICDCSHSLKTGEHCDREAPMFGLAGSQSAVFQLDRKQRMHSISFMFQTLTRDGTLLRIHSTHSSLSSRNQGAILRRESAVFQLTSRSRRLEFTAEIAARKFSLSLPPIRLTGHSAEYWNFVAVQFRSHSRIRVSVNGGEATLTTSNWEWNAERVEVGEGMIGCLSQLTLNRFEALTEGVVSGHSCPAYRDVSLHIPFSDNRLQGLLVRGIRLRPGNLILQMEFLLSVGGTDRGLLLISLPRHSDTLRVRVSGQRVQVLVPQGHIQSEVLVPQGHIQSEVLVPQGHIQSEVLVADSAWHKLELTLRTSENRTWLRVSVDGYSESAVFSDIQFPGNLIGELRLGDDNTTSIGGCLRNVALFGSSVSLSSLLSALAANQSADSCPLSTPCDFSPCANGASCETGSNTSLLCHCSAQFFGRFCTNSTTLQLGSQPLIAYLLPSLVVGVVLVVGALVCAVAKISRRGTGSYRTREETGISIIQGSSYSLRDHLSDTFMPPPRPTLEWPV